MQQTTNYSLNKFDSTDLLETTTRTGLNNNADIIDQELKNANDDIGTLTARPYIVEQGTSGIWTYRKWSNGTAECWGTTGTLTIPVTSTWGSIYTSGSSSKGNTQFPFEFADVPHLSVFVSTTYSCWVSVDANRVNSLTATQTGDIGLARPTATTINDAKISFYAIGQWTAA